MKLLIGTIIFLILVIELIARFSFAPYMEEHCLQRKHIFSPAKEKVCSCFKDKIISERYYLTNNIANDLVNRVLGDDKALEENSQSNRSMNRIGNQCLTMQDYDVKEHIKQNLHKDIGNNLTELLSSTERNLLEDLQITSYNIQVLPDNMIYRYVVDVEVTAKVRVFFGVVEYQSYQGELHYNVQGQVIHSLSNWKRSKKHVDPSGLFNGIKQAKEFFDEN